MHLYKPNEGLRQHRDPDLRKLPRDMWNLLGNSGESMPHLQEPNIRRIDEQGSKRTKHSRDLQVC